MPDGPPSPADYREAAALREGLRRFTRRSEEIAAAHGLTPRRHLLLVMIEGAPGGSGRATVTELAARMQLAQNTVTDLVARAERAGLVRREASATDGRRVPLSVSDEGRRRLAATVAALRDDRARLTALVRALGEG